ncbi:hypothetical protein Golob_011673 [Gossypium lobatum]|uniref:Zinc knuckle CX2CX4HX4C domain-containing protein n=1 Tax=Gossypium lobatum TaxID=34289 RepID=A0A7J8MQQ0_9ROSI|nr:hypothetical protein [Gossypium lobatum]
MRNTLANLWHPLGGLQIWDLGEKLYLFRFYNKVVKGVPWAFNNHLLIGNFIGAFEEYDLRQISNGVNQYLHIRVRIDVRFSFKRRKKIQISLSNFIYARFQYEQLTLFCFICGRLGHGDSFCPIRLNRDFKETEIGWDISLRAPMRKASTTTSDNPIEGLDGKKRLRTPESTTNVSGFIDALGVTDESIHAYCKGSLAVAKEQADRLLYGDKIGFAENGGSSWKVWFSTWYCRTDWMYEGGLRLGWRTNVSVSLRSYSRYYIDVEVHDENFNGNWRTTGFYGSSDMRYRIKVWDDLKGLGQAPLKWEPPY